jgi:hypothetical protein
VRVGEARSMAGGKPRGITRSAQTKCGRSGIRLDVAGAKRRSRLDGAWGKAPLSFFDLHRRAKLVLSCGVEWRSPIAGGRRHCQCPDGCLARCFDCEATKMRTWPEIRQAGGTAQMSSVTREIWGWLEGADLGGWRRSRGGISRTYGGFLVGVWGLRKLLADVANNTGRKLMRSLLCQTRCRPQKGRL